jgi:hypothetical protein
MTTKVSRLTPVPPELAKIDPKQVNHELLLEVVDHLSPLLGAALREKRSGFQGAAYLYVQLYEDLVGLSHGQCTGDLNTLFKSAGRSFQKLGKPVFSNGKTRRAVPDQPAMSRFLQQLQATGKTEEFGNLVLHALLCYVKGQGLLSHEVTLIADYVVEACQKDRNDPYCFGTQKGKAKHKTLAFSIIAGGIHLVVATFAIRKQQHKLPLFAQVKDMLEALEFQIDYALLDRGFYRKELFVAFRKWGITVIMPARASAQARQKVRLWVQGKGGRRARFTLDLTTTKKWGTKDLMMDMVLEAKRGHSLTGTKTALARGEITPDQAAKQVFPLLVSRAPGSKIRKITGNETYVRDLYRRRWAIEILFREMHKLGIANWVQGRSKRLFQFNCKCVVYNLWQVEREKLQRQSPGAAALTLDEFCGRRLQNRSRRDVVGGRVAAPSCCA